MALAFGAFFTVAVTLGIESAILSAAGQGGANAFYIIVAPLVEEIIKIVCILGVAFALPEAFPNRRYGAAFGAATGLGFGALSGILSISTGKMEGAAAFVKVIVTPLSNPLWSAFAGISVFVFISNWQKRKSFSDALSWLTFAVFLFGLVNHIIWNAIGVLIPNPVTSGIVNAVVAFPPFAFLLRDLLGGHFNFNRFFEHIEEIPLPPT